MTQTAAVCALSPPRSIFLHSPFPMLGDDARLMLLCKRHDRRPRDPESAISNTHAKTGGPVENVASAVTVQDVVGRVSVVPQTICSPVILLHGIPISPTPLVHVMALV
jgi:hypothetical protein